MVTVDRSYNPWNYFTVYAGIVRRSSETFDINYDTLYFILLCFRLYNSKIPDNLFRLYNPNIRYISEKKIERARIL